MVVLCLLFTSYLISWLFMAFQAKEGVFPWSGLPLRIGPDLRLELGDSPNSQTVLSAEVQAFAQHQTT